MNKIKTIGLLIALVTVSACGRLSNEQKAMDSEESSLNDATAPLYEIVSKITINEGPFQGTYKNSDKLCRTVQASLPNTCVRLDGQKICDGNAPCYSIVGGNIDNGSQPPASGDFSVESGPFVGSYQSIQDFCAKGKSITNHCLNLNKKYTCSGIGPCFSVYSSDYNQTPTTVVSPPDSPSTTIYQPTTTMAQPTTTVPKPSTTVPTATTTTTIPTTAGKPFEGCPAGTLKIDKAYGNSAISTADYGGFGGNILSVRFTIPLNVKPGATGKSVWAEYASAPTVRTASFSKKACDFSAQNSLKNSKGQALISTDANSVHFSYQVGSPGSFSAAVTPGETYYVNIKNEFSTGEPTCYAECGMRGGVTALDTIAPSTTVPPKKPRR